MNKSKFFLTLSAMFLLAGCTTNTQSSTAPGSAGDSSGQPVSSSTAGGVTYNKTNADFSRGKTTYKDLDGETKQFNRSSIYANAGAPHVNSHPTTGVKQRLLVCPIAFSDSTGSYTPNETLLNKIKIAFTGTKEETDAVGGSYSVQEFYKRSSYGVGEFEVTVIPTWINYPGTAAEFRTASNGQGGVFAAGYARDWYYTEYAKEGHGSLGADAKPLSYFDSDGDGYIDLMWNPYAHEYTQNDTSFWWAYVTYTGYAKGTADKPQVMTLGWASTLFMAKAYNGYDAHTFIHETGHTLGLDDYYDYQHAWSPVGKVDYMEGNLGDHNSYSKFSLGWTNPIVIKQNEVSKTEGATIELRSATLTGDCLVLAPSDYNGTAFDEYLMVELVGPWGITETDYKTGYEGTTGFTQPGIRVFHVDARTQASLATRDSDDYRTADLVGQKSTDIRIANSKFGRGGVRSDGDYWTDGKAKTSYAQLTMLEASFDPKENGILLGTYNANNNSLFTKGSRFSLTGTAGKSRASLFMPSGTNLWNRAKTTTGWNGEDQTYTINQDKTCDFFFRVKDIVTDPEVGAKATLEINLN